MLRILTYSAVAIVGLLVVLALMAYLLPRTVHVERQIRVEAPPEDVFAQVNSLRAWNAWSPWEQRDPSMDSRFEGPDVGVGATHHWASSESGSGRQTIVGSEPPHRIETDLDFGAQGTARSMWTFERAGSGTVVTWGIDADMGNSPIGRWMGLMVGTDFEAGLTNLKTVVEDGAAS